MFLEIPVTHTNLLTSPIIGVLSTMTPNGQQQSSLVWCDFDGECACVNTTLERQKGGNMTRNPKVSLLIVNPENTGKYLEIRGELGLVVDGALEHLDKITREYTGHPQFYGYVYPCEQQACERRVIGRIHPKKITMDAIHN